MQPVITAPEQAEGQIVPRAPDIDAVGNNAFANISDLFNSSGLGAYADGNLFLSILNYIWTTYALLAYIFSIFLLVIYVYASTRKRQLDELRLQTVLERERIWDEQYRSGPKNDRLTDIMNHIASEHPNDWKLAIIEADIMLDLTLKERGYGGGSLGERLRSISPAQLQSLDDAWQAHKVRNQIAHAGADFVLTRRLADETIKQYRRVFAELGVV